MRTYIVEWADGETRPVTAPSKAQARCLAAWLRPGIAIVDID